MRIAVTGGTGFLGRALVARLRRDGHDVTVLTRRPSQPGDVPWVRLKPDTTYEERRSGRPPGPPVLSDTDTAPHTHHAVATALDEVDAVVNLAGAPLAGARWTSARKAGIRNSRVRTTRALVSAIRSARRTPAVLLSGSAVGVYGPRGDEPLTEEAPAGFDFLASVCAEWEGEALEAAGSTRVVLLRTGIVLGRDGGALPRMAMPFRWFAGGALGSGRQYLSWIHLEDWVEMTIWALRSNAVSGPLNVTAPGAVTNADFARALGRALARPAFLRAPAFALRLALGEMADAVLTGQRVVPAKALSLGFEFRYPTLARALAAIYR